MGGPSTAAAHEGEKVGGPRPARPNSFRRLCATGPRKKFDVIFSGVDTTHQRDRRTDRHQTTANTALTHCRVPAPEDLNNSRLFKTFSFTNSRPIQGLVPVNHSIAYNATGTGEKTH